MILKGSQRGGAMQLARHLLNAEDNEHVEVYELRGFVATRSLGNALQEVVAISKGTRCQQMLFSLSLSPPKGESVSIADFEAAIAKVERKLGLTDQARAIVFHEKEGRRHAHAVWSRIDVDEMKAINLPYFKLKLKDVSKQLYLEHCWTLPEGLRDTSNRDPMTFSREEWQQAKRAKQDPAQLKAMFQECWSVSDGRASLARALEEHGFWLAQGDRRGFVALDYRGEVYALSRWTGQKAKDIAAKLGDPASLPSVQDTKSMIGARMSDHLRRYIRDAETALSARTVSMTVKKAQIKERHCAARESLHEAQALRWADETVERAGRFRKGVRGLWDWMTGKTKVIRVQNEKEAWAAMKRDDVEREEQRQFQLAQRRKLQDEFQSVKTAHTQEIAALKADVARYLNLARGVSDNDAASQPDHVHELHEDGRGSARQRDDGMEL